MIDLKESFYAVQNSPEYQMNEIAIRLITDNIQLIIQALTLPAVVYLDFQLFVVFCIGRE